MIVAVDPGKVTGIAMKSSQSEKPFSLELDDVDVWEYVAQMAGSNWPDLAWVVERYNCRSGALSEQHDAQNVIGHVVGQARLHGQPLHFQEVGTVKPWSTNEKLRRAGWWAVGQDHGRDALRHLMYFMCNTPEGMLQGGAELLRRIA